MTENKPQPDDVKRPGADAAEVRIPVSIGEVFDKITILQIKAERIKDATKLRNVAYELGLLRALAAPFEPAGHDKIQLAAELKSVNTALWEIEDDLRACEQRQDFGAGFIALARSVYQLNDQRAAIKKRINLIYGSHLIEEKSYGRED